MKVEKMNNVSGISSSGAKKATDMQLKCQYISEINNGRGIVFATGTPISNTMCEMYVMQLYLQKAALERMGIYHFDSQAANFGEVTTALELTVEGSGFQFKSRFNKFTNLPELMNIFREVADVQTSDMLDLDVPKLRDGKYIIVESEPDWYVKQVMEDFVVRAERIRNGGVDPSVDNFLKITHEARLLGTDARLLDKDAPNNPDGKLNKVVENVIYEYDKAEADNKIGCQLILCAKQDGKMTELEYDCRNRLIKAGEITYEYDSENNRIATNTPKYREEYVTTTIGTLPHVLLINRYDVKDDKNSDVNNKDNVTETRAYADEVSSQVVCYYGNGLEYETTLNYKTKEKTIKYHHYNNVGNTIYLTNSKGKVVEEYSYGTYGELLSGDASKSKFLYNGQYGIQTDINNLYYMRSRYYNPEVKRFINQDTLLGDIKNSQSLNRYAYVQGNPITLTDPFGTNPIDQINKFLSVTGHTLSGIVGLFNPLGDLAETYLYYKEGNKKEAFTSILSAIPGEKLVEWIGNGIKAIRSARKTARAAKQTAELASGVTSSMYKAGPKGIKAKLGDALSKRNRKKASKALDTASDAIKDTEQRIIVQVVILVEANIFKLNEAIFMMSLQISQRN